jgi:hypothetical protein
MFRRNELPPFSGGRHIIYKTTWQHISVLLTLIKDSCLSGLLEPEGGSTISQNVGSYLTFNIP